ncbi:N-acetyltransferase [Taibaiella sp. KBW10]|uniref:GNAT family N-acetyltransferase n=1 Tax=Taibaiella sp. KBW10 TaxID=2153357 RepID=UPI000F592CE3|nr:GNAT family N-acetyltransferase [Taibaiella sp. KBW10]RQO32101.1 N-acetyltransferase [Taibaiella sp. KBW10]
MITFQEAQKDNLAFINDTYNESIPAGLATADTQNLPMEEREIWFAQHQKSNRPVWILKNEEAQSVGWLSLSNFYGRPAYRNTVEISLYISNKHQGKGYGKMALATLIELAPGLAIQNLMGFIFAHNEASIRLFQHFGFETWGLFPEIAHMPQGNRSLMILGKKLK